MTKDELIYIEGKKLILRPLVPEDFTPAYLRWLNDPIVNEFSQRRPYPQTHADMVAYNDYYLNNREKGFVLAMIDRGSSAHIGNISLVNIQTVNRCAEIAILIGDTEFWNKGYASESIYLLTKHTFSYLNIHKVFAGTFNPSFVKCVEKLGWKKEGEFRERIWSAGKYHTQFWYSILETEFKANPNFEK